jgi:Activator of Hsp90 ATPase homolog 1-like protein
MNNDNLTIAFTVQQSPDQAFAAITSVRDWWSGEIEGRTDQHGAVFTYRYQDIHRSTQRITELVPARRVVWHIEDSYLSFVPDKSEWTGTDVIFEVTPTDAGTEVRFTHVGLAPDVPCFDSCSSAWQFYIGGSLRNLITQDQGQPNPKEHATPSVS